MGGEGEGSSRADGTAAAGAGDLLDVVLPRFPLRLFLRWQERIDGLMRELALVSMSAVDTQGVPSRLIALAHEVTATYSGAAAQAAAAREEALARGDRSIDLVYTVPRAAAAHAARLEEILAEADAYCIAERLLTLEAPIEFIAFRHWYFGNVIRQCQGFHPVAWSGPLD